MRRVPLRRVLLGPAPPADRILFYGIWFRGHNNPRYAELLPRLRRVDPCLLVVAERQPLRALTYRLALRTRRYGDAAVFRAAGRRYRALFTADLEQIDRFAGPVVADVDDTDFSAREVELLSRPNLRAYVVTAEEAARRFEARGVSKPYHVVPQGVALSSIPDGAIAVAAAKRRETPLVVGYLAAWLLLEGDRGGQNPLYNVEHLLELWDEIHGRIPEARLWLMGGASERVRQRLAGRDDIVLFGRLPREQALAHVANFDIALYPRAADQGVRSVKVTEYLGLGVPTVSYDYAVTSELRDTGAGILVRTPREFADAVEHLGRSEGERHRLAEAARRAGAERNWDVLGARYEEILDRHLPRT